MVYEYFSLENNNPPPQKKTVGSFMVSHVMANKHFLCPVVLPMIGKTEDL